MGGSKGYSDGHWLSRIQDRSHIINTKIRNSVVAAQAWFLVPLAPLAVLGMSHLCLSCTKSIGLLLSTIHGMVTQILLDNKDHIALTDTCITFLLLQLGFVAFVLVDSMLY